MATLTHSSLNFPDLLFPLRWIVNHIEIHDAKTAHRICHLIPCSCPFERDVTILNHTFHVPALCKLNPLYNEVIALRLRALIYLSDECGEDVTPYIC